MNKFAEKYHDQKNQRQDNKLPKEQNGGEQVFQFEDNRSEAQMQNQLQQLDNNRADAIKQKNLNSLIANKHESKKSIQLQTKDKTVEVPQQNIISNNENNTGLPDNLKSGIESLSGISLSDVKVHRNSDKPAQLQAHAFAQGTNIHLGPGQEKHLPHEAWHVVQQKQGRVKPTRQLKSAVAINDSPLLEKEADLMGNKALQQESSGISELQSIGTFSTTVAQRVIKGLEEYTEPGNIPDDWVEAFKSGLTENEAHINKQDIQVIYSALNNGADIPENVSIENIDSSHWDLQVNGADGYKIVTRHDGNCGIHVASAITGVVSNEIKGAQDGYHAGDDFIARARTALKSHYDEAVDPDAIKGIIAQVINDKDNLPATGFGTDLQNLILATGKIDTRDQDEILDQIHAMQGNSDVEDHQPAAVEQKRLGKASAFSSKQSGAAEDWKSQFRAKARVGLELTFFNKDTAKYVTNEGFPKGTDTMHAEGWWEAMLLSWRESLTDTENLDCKVARIGKNKNFGYRVDEMDLLRATYTDRNSGAIVFWLQISMDPGVVEIQTHPITGKDLMEDDGDIRIIMETIYDVAHDLNLTPGKGGGHINLDFKTGLDQNYSLIPRILLATDYVVANLKHINRERYNKLVDVDNEKEDPFISTERINMEHDAKGNWSSKGPRNERERNYQGEWESKVLTGRRVKNANELKAFRDVHAKWLLLHPTNTQYKKSDKPGAKILGRADEDGLNAVIHYQAVNIDHLFDEILNGDDPRRIEFRFFKAQESIEDIIDGINLIAEIIQEAKRKQ